MFRRLVLFAALLTLSGCATMRGEVPDDVQPLVASQELDSAELLDIAIVIFEAEELTDKQITELGLSKEIRQAEERYIPIHLKYTMQRTGYWGAVRVVPAENAAHLQVRGTITHSDGERLSLDIEAYDSRNVKWFAKSYSEDIRLTDFAVAVAGEEDPFQDLYNSIANDLVEHRATLTSEDLTQIQRVSELRLAQDMAPDAFADHLVRNQEDHFELARLPAADDPMLKRVHAIQARDEMLLDTINGYYDGYYSDLWQPYTDWRRLYNEELIAMQKVEKEAALRKLLGLASIVGGVLLSSDSSVNSSNLPQVMVLGGAAAIYSGFQRSEDTRIHKEVIEELSISFASEAEPLVVDVVGETVRLTGSAEDQYRKWRELLREIYASETGFPLESSEVEAGNATSDQTGAM